MIKAAILSLSALGLAISCSQVKQVHHIDPRPNAIPTLTILNDTSAAAMRMSSLDIDVKVAANMGVTTFDIRFYNPNDRILEGEFEFPLADGQHITRYALDINGSLREGVVVEKVKARIAFESTIRRKIDPGLVEKTKGNNFRTRIYPIPAKGYRRIVIAVEQTLEQEVKDLVYQLPLYSKSAIDSFAFKATVIKASQKPQFDEAGMPGMEFKKEKATYTAEHSAKQFIANHTIAFKLPGSGGDSDVILTENASTSPSTSPQTYFYVNSRIEAQQKEKKKPSTIGVLWDISASASKRDTEKEISLLKKYLSEMDAETVSLIPFNIYAEPKQDFTSTSDLIDKIKSFTYDGGTQLGAIDLSKYTFDEVLLFSDGISTFGKEEAITGNTPVITVTTSPSANYSWLKYIAHQTHGSFIDLGKLEPADALKAMSGQSLQVIKMNYDPSAIDELVVQVLPISNTGLSFAGKLKTGSATIKAELGFGNEVVMTKEFTITQSEDSDYDQVKNMWATMLIDQLDMEFEKNKEAITKLGKEFSIVTQNTSLLVLDRVEDYVEHEITPPAELLKEYTTLLRVKRSQANNDKEIALNEAVVIMQNLKEWWKRDYSKRKVLPDDNDISDDTMVRFTPPVIVADEEVMEAPALNLTMADSVQRTTTRYNYSTVVGSNSAALLPGEEVVSNFATGSGDAEYKRGESPAPGSIEPEPSIDIKQWKAGADYLQKMEKASVDKRLATYLELKKQYGDQPSFFVDVARFFLEKNEKKIGLLILSNVSEMKLEEAELARIVANQLLEVGEKELALESFRQVLKMREEDPQSYRDLALAYNETGDYNKAVELLYKLVSQTWDSRFGDVKAIALNEMNAIISAHTGAVNIAAIDKRLIYAMPMDVRIIIGWNTDNSDIDLWVTDPRKEKCFYSHKETAMGGKISQDVTMGYGPEEFSLKKAVNGKYVIEANLYGDSREGIGGPIAIKAELFTDFGKPTQKRKTINFRVETSNEVVTIGELKFGS